MKTLSSFSILSFFALLMLLNKVSAQSATYDKVIVNDTLQLDYVKGDFTEPNAKYNLSLSVDSSGRVKTAHPNQVQTFVVDEASSILGLDLAVNTIVYTNNKSKYIVKNDTITGFPIDSCVVIPTNNGKYAILQTRNGGFYVEDFGAVANDGIDDSDAIQKCIDAVIKLPNVTSKVNVGPGIFNLDKGIVVARKNSTEFSFVTIQISGNIPVYDPNQATGTTSSFKLQNPTFGIAVQQGRNCLVENIFFTGSASDYSSFSRKQRIEGDSTLWGAQANARINKYSPSCAIAIDPFHENVLQNNRYPGLNDFYTNSSNSGTSMLTIKGCGFRNHYIAISNNSSVGVQNGDNIRAENCHVKYCHTFWAAGQTQSRSNSIDNVYSIGLNTFVNCGLIGPTSKGTPPVITNCNIAGFTKEVIRMPKKGFSSFRMSNCYMESVFSLGNIQANNVSFHQCQIKFLTPEDGDGIFAAPYLLSSTNVSFVDCSIEFFSNCNIQQPFLLNSQKVSIRGGNIEGGVVLGKGFSNAGGEKIHDVRYENVFLECFGKYAGTRYSGTPLINSHGNILLGGDELQTNWEGNSFALFKNNKPTYNINYYGSIQIHIDSTLETAYFIHPEPERIKVGDNLIHGTGGSVDASVINMEGTFRGALGYVTYKKSDTIVLSGVPYGLSESEMRIYRIEYPIFYMPFWGNISLGSDTIKNAVAWKKRLPPVGARIYNDAFPSGAYVTDVNSTDSIIIMSAASTKNDSSTYFRNAHVKQTVFWNNSYWSPNASLPYIEGSRILFDDVQPTVNGYVTVMGGAPGSSSPPTFGALTH